MAGTQKWTSVRIVFQSAAEFCGALGIGKNQHPTEWLKSCPSWGAACCAPTKKNARLNLLALPAAALEKNHADAGDEGFRDNDGYEHASRLHSAGNCEKVCQRNLQHPEADKIDQRRRQRIPRAVERLQHYHATRPGEVSVAENAQAGGCEWDHCEIVCEKTNNGLGEKNEN